MTILQFLLSIHYMACGWCFIHSRKKFFGFDHIDFSSENDTENYIEAVYFITTTISTVGFGDFKGFPDLEGNWAIEMTYLMFVTAYGIVLFSSVVNEIFTYKKLKTVSQIVHEQVKDTEEYLYQISKAKKNYDLP